MKKVVYLTLTVCLLACMMMPICAFADENLAMMYANEALEIIHQYQDEEEVDVYTYIETLELVLKAIDETEKGIYSHYLHATYGLTSIEITGDDVNIVIDEEDVNQLHALLVESGANAAEWRSNVLDDAAKCFANQHYGLSILEIHAKFIFDMVDTVNTFISSAPD